MENEINKILSFSKELSKIINWPILVEDIHATYDGCFDFIQAPEVGAPMLLSNSHGSFFVNMNPEDYRNIYNGSISPHEYIYSANWQIGYYWGGNNMVDGGYYQPFDIVKNKKEVSRYLQILVCRGRYYKSGHMPSEKNCEDCSLEKCPFSQYKKGTWKNEIEEYDPRKDFFKALCYRFENQFYGYTLQGFSCLKGIEEDTVRIFPNWRYSENGLLSFYVYVSENVIRNLLMRKDIPENWNEYVKIFKFQILKNEQCFDATEENIKKIYCVDKENVKKTSDGRNINKGKSVYTRKILRFLRNVFGI